MDFLPKLDASAEVPLYRQLFEQIAEEIRTGRMARGERLPATRELAGQLGLNRTTVSAAYELLETEGLIAGQVGRGSFVLGRGPSKLDWVSVLGREGTEQANLSGGVISFAVSRPSRELFPLEAFRMSARAVMEREDLADILQLGSPAGFEPLRQYLLESARDSGLAGPDDDLLITNGCQQGMDLIGRVLVRPGDAVAVEDPIYPGLKSLLTGMGAQLSGVPCGQDGMDPSALERVLERDRPRFVVVTSNFQNPTGGTLPLASRRAIADAVRRAGVPLIENDAYGELRYSGEPLPAIKQLDEHGGTLLLRSFSKVSFPGLRVGWAVGPRPLLERLRAAKQSSDLHTDQLSQAVLLEFAQKGRLHTHREKVLRAGAERLAATLAACGEFLPKGSWWTLPEGGMNVWVRLPEPLDAGDLLGRAQRAGVAYLPGRFFAVGRLDPGTLRLSFAGLSPVEIRRGLEILGSVIDGELKSAADRSYTPSPAMV